MSDKQTVGAPKWVLFSLLCLAISGKMLFAPLMRVVLMSFWGYLGGISYLFNYQNQLSLSVITESVIFFSIHGISYLFQFSRNQLSFSVFMESVVFFNYHGICYLFQLSLNQLSFSVITESVVFFQLSLNQLSFSVITESVVFFQLSRNQLSFSAITESVVFFSYHWISFGKGIQMKQLAVFRFPLGTFKNMCNISLYWHIATTSLGPSILKRQIERVSL